MSSSTAARPRYGAGLLVLLVLVSLANMAALWLGVHDWADWASHTSSTGTAVLNPASVGTALSVVAMVGIVGAWLRRPWGPALYFAVQAIAFVVLLALGAGGLGIIPLALAGLLWWAAERAR